MKLRNFYDLTFDFLFAFQWSGFRCCDPSLLISLFKGICLLGMSESSLVLYFRWILYLLFFNFISFFSLFFHDACLKSFFISFFLSFYFCFVLLVWNFYLSFKKIWYFKIFFLLRFLPLLLISFSLLLSVIVDISFSQFSHFFLIGSRQKKIDSGRLFFCNLAQTKFEHFKPPVTEVS
jgi:hypothetical protein